MTNHNHLNIIQKRDQMNEGLEVDPNPSSFLPLIFVLHNSTNLLPFACFYNLSLSKLPPTSDTSFWNDFSFRLRSCSCLLGVAFTWLVSLRCCVYLVLVACVLPRLLCACRVAVSGCCRLSRRWSHKMCPTYWLWQGSENKATSI